MADYQVDADDLFSDDDPAAPAPHSSSSAPPPPPKRPRTGSRALESLNSLNLFGTSRPRFNTGPPRQHSARRPVIREPANHGGGRAQNQYGREPMGSHMRAGAPPPTRGRPGIHPSRVAMLAREERPRTARLVSVDDDDDEPDAAAAAVASILPEADRERLMSRPSRPEPARKRPSRRVRRDVPEVPATSGGDTITHVRRETDLDRAHEARRAERERHHADWAKGMSEKRRKGLNGRAKFSLESIIGKQHSAQKKKREAPKRVRNDNDLRTMYMNAALGKDAVKQERREAMRLREEVAMEYQTRREEEREMRLNMAQQMALVPTVASRMRELRFLKYFERNNLFGGHLRTLKDKVDSVGLIRKSIEKHPTVENVFFIEVTELDI